MEVEFKYNFSDTFIKFKLIEEKNEVWMLESKIDYVNSKIFFMLLRNAIEKFQKDNYKTFVQTILKEDWDLIKNFNWKIRDNNKSNPFIIIECELDKALENIGRGLGYGD